MRLPFYFGLTILASCAGPHNPFGSRVPIFSEKKDYKLDIEPTRSIASDEIYIPKIEFYPKKKSYHNSGVFKFTLDTYRVDEDARIQFFYNNENITDQIIERAKITQLYGGKKVVFEIPRFKLPPHMDHDIKVKFLSKNYKFESSYEEPSCPLNEIHLIHTTTPFRVRNSFIHKLKRVGRNTQINPSLLAGLIAKESGFNTKAVSWAKAIGLTQITSLAEVHILEENEKWPTYPGLNRLSVPTIKTLIALGKVNSSNEWRLNKDKSVLGAVSYLNYLDRSWNNQSDNIRSLASREDYILASYNSGATRVKRAMNSKGKNWLNHHELGEAKKYVKLVKSYCYHFSNIGGSL